MTDPRTIASHQLGPIEWESEVTGWCKCPGESLHTHRTGKKDCRVSVDGAPTIHCFHASCIAAVESANKTLRRSLGQVSWQITLEGGKILRSGDIVTSPGVIKRRETIKAEAQANGSHLVDQVFKESLRATTLRIRTDLFTEFHWPFSTIVEDSPCPLAHRDAEDHFRTWLKLWPAHCYVWIGDIFSSGKPEHATHFRPVSDWYQIGPVMGNFTCGSSFKPGSFQRSNANCNGTRFMVIESDTLPKDEVGAIFAYLNKRLHFNLHVIIDTAGKSLHGWFDAPRTKGVEDHLKIVLTTLGCDPKLFTYSQPVRVPGALRDGKVQKIIWLRE